MKKLLFAIILFCGAMYPQDSTMSDINLAYANALKGIDWALKNIPEKKQRLNNDLIENNTLISSVNLSKEINGYKIESQGFYLNSEIAVKIYRSDEWLLNKGYLKPVIKEEPLQQNKKPVTVKGRKKQKNTI